MKKKIMFLIVLFLGLFLTSCSLFNSGDTKKQNVVGYIDINTGVTDKMLQDAVSKVEDSNVLISIETTKKSGFLNLSVEYKIQSAVIYKNVLNEYYVVTSFDEADTSASNYNIIISDDTTNMISASLVGCDKTNDVAVYKFKSLTKYTPVSLSSNYTTKVGDMVFSIASMQESVESISNYDFEEDAYNLYNGIVEYSNGLLIKHEAMASTRNCGSALYDYDGNMIGLNVYKIASTATSSSAEGGEDLDDFNFAIESDALCTIISQIENNGNVSRPSASGSYLEYNYIEGLTTQPYYTYNSNAQTTGVFTFPSDEKHGLYIYAKGLGNSFNKMNVGDFITEINGTTITSITVFKNILALSLSSDTITLTAYRNGNKISYTNKSL